MPVCNETAGANQLASIALLLARICLCPLQFWLKGTYRSPAYLFKPLDFTQEAQEALLLWYSFMTQPKLKHWPSPGICNNRCLNRRLWRVHEQPVLKGLVARKDGQGDPHQSLRTRGCLQIMSTVQRGYQGEGSLLQDRQHNSSVLYVGGGQHILQETELSCMKNLAQLP